MQLQYTVTYIGFLNILLTVHHVMILGK